MYLTEQTIDQRHAEYLTLDDVLLDTIDSWLNNSMFAFYGKIVACNWPRYGNRDGLFVHYLQTLAVKRQTWV